MEADDKRIHVGSDNDAAGLSMCDVTLNTAKAGLKYDHYTVLQLTVIFVYI